MARPTFIDLRTYRRAIIEGRDLGEVALRKEFVCAVGKPDGDGARVFPFTISTSAVDRYQDTIAVDGWKIDAYMRNPVVLWGHNADIMPIGRSLKVWRDGDALKSIAEFVPADDPGNGNFVESVVRKLRDGFLSAVSVGFRPLKALRSVDPQRPYGIDFVEQELLEYSVVTIPANADALIDARAAGDDDEPEPDPADGNERAAAVAARFAARRRSIEIERLRSE